MPGRAFDYAIIRLVPSLERGECLNIGVLMQSPPLDFLGARTELDGPRALALFPHLNLESIRQHMDAWRCICAGSLQGGPIAALPPRERFAWLTTPRNTMIQTSPVHGGVTEDPAVTLEGLFDALVRPVRTP